MHLFIELCGENISKVTTRTLCDRLQKEKIEALCLRECSITDKDFTKILKRVGTSYSIRHLSLCVDVVVDSFRVQTVATSLQENLSLSGLFLHGSPIGDSGIKILQQSLLQHPGIVKLDLSDCQLGDGGVEYICQLLPADRTKQGLRELVLSSNPGVTSIGWNKLSIALASGNQLSTFCIDYNDIGDAAAACILTAIAGSTTLEKLDMECTELTELTGTLFLQLLNKAQMNLKDINLDENDILPETMENIRLCVHGTELTLEQNLDVHSDDDHSLATSEPPLDDTNSLIGYDKTSRRSSADEGEESVTYINTDIVPTNGATIANTNKVQPLADRIQLTRSADVLDQKGGHEVEQCTMRSRSMINIRPKEDVEDLNLAIKAVRSCTRIDVNEQQDDKSNIRHANRNDEFETNKHLLIPETPSFVSLHVYDRSQSGQEDGEFQPFDKMFVRPTSAPIVQPNRLTVQGIGSAAVGQKTRLNASVSLNMPTTTQSPRHLAPITSQRRYSTGNALSVNGPEEGSVHTSLKSVSVLGMSDSARASLTSASVRNMSELDNYSNDGDLDLEEL